MESMQPAPALRYVTAGLSQPGKDLNVPAFNWNEKDWHKNPEKVKCLVRLVEQSGKSFGSKALGNLGGHLVQLKSDLPFLDPSQNPRELQRVLSQAFNALNTPHLGDATRRRLHSVVIFEDEAQSNDHLLEARCPTGRGRVKPGRIPKAQRGTTGQSKSARVEFSAVGTGKKQPPKKYLFGWDDTHPLLASELCKALNLREGNQHVKGMQNLFIHLPDYTLSEYPNPSLYPHSRQKVYVWDIFAWPRMRKALQKAYGQVAARCPFCKKISVKPDTKLSRQWNSHGKNVLCHS